ncbi:HAD family hydrolase [Anaerohalosphaera lusitana]|nr:HAD family hydrolase [Anaerohalosphaera lusitana]
MPIKAVIFDLDGTITQPCLDFDLIRQEMGLAEDAGPILEYLENMPPDDRKQAETILERHEDQAAVESCLNNGAKETIEELCDRGIKVGILTRNKRTNAIAVRDKHGLHFDAVIAREDGPAKPDPHGVLALCKEFGTSPRETILVGDYLHDLLTAKAADVTAILIETHKDADKFWLDPEKLYRC